MSESGGSLTVVIADDHTVVREGVRALLERDPELEVVGLASDGAEAIDMVIALKPSVVVLDVSMPGITGLQAAKIIKARSDCHVLILSMHDDPEYVLEAVRAGADGYILKDSAPMDLRQAVRSVAAGAGYYPTSITEQLTAGVREEGRRQGMESRIDRLTDREREVLLLIAKGRTSREIAGELAIGVRTVETHRHRVMEKTGIKTVAGLTRLVIGAGMDDSRGP